MHLQRRVCVGGKSSQDCVRLDYCGRRSAQLLSTIEPPVNFCGSLGMMLVPRAHSGHHATRVDSKSAHSLQLQLPAAFGQVATNPFNRGSAQASDSSIRLRDQETSPPFDRHRERFRLDLDDTVAPAHVQRRARLDRRFTTDLGRNHQAARPRRWWLSWYEIYHAIYHAQRVDSMENR